MTRLSLTYQILSLFFIRLHNSGWRGCAVQYFGFVKSLRQAGLCQHFDFVLVTLVLDSEVRMRRCGAELVSGQNEKYVGCHFAEHLVKPHVLEGNGYLQQVHDDTCEVDVADDHDVELTE